MFLFINKIRWRVVPPAETPQKFSFPKFIPTIFCHLQIYNNLSTSESNQLNILEYNATWTIQPHASRLCIQSHNAQIDTISSRIFVDCYKLPFARMIMFGNNSIRNSPLRILLLLSHQFPLDVNWLMSGKFEVGCSL